MEICSVTKDPFRIRSILLPVYLPKSFGRKDLYSRTALASECRGQKAVKPNAKKTQLIVCLECSTSSYRSCMEKGRRRLLYGCRKPFTRYPITRYPITHRRHHHRLLRSCPIRNCFHHHHHHLLLLLLPRITSIFQVWSYLLTLIDRSEDDRANYRSSPYMYCNVLAYQLEHTKPSSKNFQSFSHCQSMNSDYVYFMITQLVHMIRNMPPHE